MMLNGRNQAQNSEHSRHHTETGQTRVGLIYVARSQDMVMLGLGLVTGREYEGLRRCSSYSCFFICVLVSWHVQFVKIQKTVHLWNMHFSICIILELMLKHTLHHYLPWGFSPLGPTNQVQPPHLVEEETKPLRGETPVPGDRASQWPNWEWILRLRLRSRTTYSFRLPKDFLNQTNLFLYRFVYTQGLDIFARRRNMSWAPVALL